MAGLENLHNFRAPLVFKFSVVLANSNKFCISEQRFAEIWVMAHVKPEKVISLIENVKYDWTALVKAPLMTAAGGVGWVWRGNSEIEQKGPSSKYTAYVLVVRFPWQ